MGPPTLPIDIEPAPGPTCGQFFLGIKMASLEPGSGATAMDLDRMELFQWHQSLGCTTLILVALRVIGRWRSELPQWAEGLSAGERKYAHNVERALYWLMGLAPLTGLLLTTAKTGSVYFFGAEIPSVVPARESLVKALSVGHAVIRMLPFMSD